MDKYEFITYAAKRNGIDESLAEYMVDVFTSTLQEAILNEQSVSIDELGEFNTTPLLSYLKGNFDRSQLDKLSKTKIVTFCASKSLKGIV